MTENYSWCINLLKIASHIHYHCVISIFDIKDVASEYQGYWIEESGSKEIHCEPVNGKLKCTWPSQVVEEFHIKADTLTGDVNQQICGWLDNERIKWNTGNNWCKKGIYI